MNRLCILTLAALMVAALAAVAQQPAAAGGSVALQPHNLDAQVDGHMAALTERLDLTSSQQARIRPILAQFLGQRQQVLQDQSLSHEQQTTQIQAMHQKADKQVRQFLNDDQKKKLDELEQEHSHS